MWLQQGNGGGRQSEDVEWQDVGNDQTTQVSISYVSIYLILKTVQSHRTIFSKDAGIIRFIQFKDHSE